MHWTQWIPHLVLVGSAFLMFAVALSYKWLHKARRRRAPLEGRRIGHLPGQQLLVRLNRHDEAVGQALAMMAMSFPVMFMTWATYKIDWIHFRWTGSETVFALGGALMFCWGLCSFVRHYRKREQASDGLLAERVTGMQLNRLVAQGCLVMHDLPADGFNIDHIVIGPRGVYMVETKSFRKPRTASGNRKDPGYEVRYDGKTLMFPDFATREPIEQAIRQAQWLRRTLRDALGRDIPVVACVALPGWFVAKSEEAKRADVLVFTPMGKGSEFMSWANPERLTQDQRRVVVETLAARYPSVDA